MTSPAFEGFLARLYTDADFRGRFLEDPRGVTVGCGLSADEVSELVGIDRVGLAMAARTFEYKRGRMRRGGFWGLLGRVKKLLWWTN